MLRLLGRATSANVQKAIFGLEEMGLPYGREDYGRVHNNTGTPEFLALSPTNKVPVLIDGDVVIWESHSILRYLAAKSSSPLYPTELAARSDVERWMNWTLASLNPAFLAGFREARKPEAERGPDVAGVVAAELSLLDGQLAGKPWIANGAFSLADIVLAPLVQRCLAYPFARPELPALTAWMSERQKRPAFVKATAAG